MNDKQTATQAQVDTAEQILTAVTKAMVLKEVDEKRYTSVPVGKTWLDTEGDPIQAHGGGFLQQTDTDGAPVYYWAGEDKAHNTSNFNGISLYSSKDLLNWTYRGTILQPDVANAGLSDNKIERPKIIYNEATHKYILWGHWEDKSGYSSSQVCVAVCDTVDGEYKFLGHWRPGADAKHRDWRISGNSAQFDDGREISSYDDQAVWGTGSRDFTIYVDGSAAYLISAEDHTTMRIYQLNSSFTDVDKDAMESYQLFQGARREAPALVKSGGYYFMISSAQSGWYPNQTRYSYTKDISDPNGWSVMDADSDVKMPGGYLGNNTTFYSQPTNIMTISGEAGTSYVYMGDRWNSKELGSSTYVWLPLTIGETDTPIMAMDYQSGWSLNTKTPEIVVPEYSLLSRGKKAETNVTVSNEDALKLANANDGEYINTNTTGGNHAYFKPGSVPFTYTIDLEKKSSLSRIDLSFNCHNGSETYYQYKVDTSVDGEKWDTSVDESGNTTVGFKSHDFNETKARYVRVSVNNVINDHNGNKADWAAGLVEVQVYGESEEIGNAKQLAEAAVAAITATNDTTKENILDAITAGIASVNEVSAAWKDAPVLTAATEDSDGSIVGTVVLTCGDEKAEIPVNKVIAKLSHSHVYDSEWKFDKNSHWHECMKGNCPDPKKDIAEHTAGDWITDKAATETTTGSKHKECIVCKYVMQTEVIEKPSTIDPGEPEDPDKPSVKQTYKVTFNLQGKGTALPEYTSTDYTDLEKGKTIRKPADPEAEGYVFTGWYKEAACKTSWDFVKDTVEADMVLYAGWILENEYTGVLPGDTLVAGSRDDFWVAAIKAQTYTGKAIKPEVHVYDKEQRLQEGRDYVLTYKNNIKAADADASGKKVPRVTVKGEGRFSGTHTVTFTITKAVLDESHLFYTAVHPKGKAYTPVVIKDGVLMNAKTDYTVSYENNDTNKVSKKMPTKEGSYTMHVSGKGSCTGEFSVPYTVLPKGASVSIAKAKAFVPVMTYRGNLPTPKLTVNKRELTEGADYFVRYANTNAKGTATAIFIGIGDYSGILKKTFKVKAASLADKNVNVAESAEYKKGGAVPEISVTVDGAKLVMGVDYTVSFKNNKKPGKTATVTIKGKGNYNGTVRRTFQVKAEKEV